MELQSPHEVLDVAPVGQLLALAAELAVACVEPELWEHEVLREAVKWGHELLGENPELDFNLDGFLDALTTPGDGTSWRATLAALLSSVPQPERFIWLADITIYSSLLEEDLLYGGVFQRRLDAVLDLAGAPFCATDVQFTFHQLVQNLADAKVTWAHSGAALAGSFAVGFAGAAFGIPGAQLAAGKGTEYFMGRVAPVDELAESCARLLVATNAAVSAGPAGDATATELQEYLLQRLVADYRKIDNAKHRRAHSGHVDVAGPQRRVRMLQCALEDARGALEGGEGTAERLVPDVLHVPLSAAHWLLTYRGAKFDFKDATPQQRGIYNLDSWRVVDQDHRPHTKVTNGVIRVRAVKYDDQ